MAKKSKVEEAAPTYREKSISEPAPPPPEPEEEPTPEVEAEETEDDVVANSSLTPEQRELKRLARMPSIDHLPNGTVVMDNGDILALFDVGDRIIAERRISFLPNHPWLDTRTYTVRSIDDEKGIIHCMDDELVHYACIGFKHDWTRIKLCPKKGNPFNAPKVIKVTQPDLQPGEKKRRGRPKGTKNRSKDVIQAEKQARKEGKAA